MSVRQVAPDINPKPYLSPNLRARHGEPKHHLKHRLVEGIYA